MSEVALTSRRVAVIAPASGVAHLLGETHASLQAQTVAGWGSVVIDDDVPDVVADAVEFFLADPRIRFASQDTIDARAKI